MSQQTQQALLEQQKELIAKVTATKNHENTLRDLNKIQTTLRSKYGMHYSDQPDFNYSYRNGLVAKSSTFGRSTFGSQQADEASAKQKAVSTKQFVEQAKEAGYDNASIVNAASTGQTLLPSQNQNVTQFVQQAQAAGYFNDQISNAVIKGETLLPSQNPRVQEYVAKAKEAGANNAQIVQGTLSAPAKASLPISDTNEENSSQRLGADSNNISNDNLLSERRSNSTLDSNNNSGLLGNTSGYSQRRENLANTEEVIRNLEKKQDDYLRGFRISSIEGSGKTVPLFSNNWIGNSAKGLLEAPLNIAGTTIVQGAKLANVIERLETPSTHLKTVGEIGEAIVPATVGFVKGLNPKTPEGFVNDILLVSTFRFPELAKRSYAKAEEFLEFKPEKTVIRETAPIREVDIASNPAAKAREVSGVKSFEQVVPTAFERESSLIAVTTGRQFGQVKQVVTILPKIERGTIKTKFSSDNINVEQPVLDVVSGGSSEAVVYPSQGQSFPAENIITPARGIVDSIIPINGNGITNSKTFLSSAEYDSLYNARPTQSLSEFVSGAERPEISLSPAESEFYYGSREIPTSSGVVESSSKTLAIPTPKKVINTPEFLGEPISKETTGLVSKGELKIIDKENAILKSTNLAINKQGPRVSRTFGQINAPEIKAVRGVEISGEARPSFLKGERSEVYNLGEEITTIEQYPAESLTFGRYTTSGNGKVSDVNIRFEERGRIGRATTLKPDASLTHEFENIEKELSISEFKPERISSSASDLKQLKGQVGYKQLPYLKEVEPTIKEFKVGFERQTKAKPYYNRDERISSGISSIFDDKVFVKNPDEGLILLNDIESLSDKRFVSPRIKAESEAIVNEAFEKLFPEPRKANPVRLERLERSLKKQPTDFSKQFELLEEGKARGPPKYTNPNGDVFTFGETQPTSKVEKVKVPSVNEQFGVSKETQALEKEAEEASPKKENIFDSFINEPKNEETINADTASTQTSSASYAYSEEFGGNLNQVSRLAKPSPYSRPGFEAEFTYPKHEVLPPQQKPFVIPALSRGSNQIQRQAPSVLIDTRSNVVQAPKTNILSVQKSAQQLKSSSASILKPDVATRTESLSKSATIFKADTAQVQKVQTDLIQVQKPALVTISRPSFTTPRTPFFEQPPLEPRTEVIPSNSDKKKRRLAIGYASLVRVRGKFERSSKVFETEREAQEEGKLRVRNSAAATLRVTRVNAEPNSVFKQRTSASDFYRKESGDLIQFAKKRISTQGEKVEITLKGIQANRINSQSVFGRKRK